MCMKTQLFVVMMLLAPVGAVWGQVCEPAARVEGDARIALQVAEELAVIGIGADAGPACPIAWVHAEILAGGWLYLRVDDQGRVAEREVASVKAAAAVVDSWLRAAPRIARRVAPSVEAAEVPSVLGELEDPLPRVVVRRPETVTSSVRVAGQVGVDTFGMGWAGGTMSACARWGRACVGLEGQLLESLGGTSHGTSARRIQTNGGSQWGVSALMATTVRQGRVGFHPALRVGVQRIELAYPWRDFVDRLSSWGPSVGAGIAVSVPVGGLEAELGLTAEGCRSGAHTSVAMNPAESSYYPGNRWRLSVAATLGFRLGTTGGR